MKLSEIARWIEISLKGEPPQAIQDIYGQYYQPYYYFMYLASFYATGLMVELGVETGRGSASLALSGRPVIGLDNKRRPGIEKIEERFPNFTFLNQPSLPVPDLVKDQAVSVLHIDTEHSYAMAKAEFEAYQPYLDSPAVIIFDDLHANDDGVLKFFSELPYPKIQDDRMHPITGWGVVLYG